MIRAVAQTRVVPLAGRRGDLLPVAAIAGGAVAFHLVLSGRYGFHRDELYQLTAGRHPALGYADHPPLVPLLARAVTAVAGEHLWPLRAVAAAAHGAMVLLAAAIARGLGGGRRAVTLGALATATMPVFLAVGSRFAPAMLDQVWWAVVLLLVVRLLDGGDPRGWLAVGAVAGAGLETAWSIALLALGLAVGVAAVPEARRLVRSVWPLAGVALALAMWLPHLAWQARNGWAAVDLVRDSGWPLADGGPLAFVVGQVALAGPLALPLVGAGLVWLWRSPPWRVLAVAAATVTAVLLVAGGEAADLGPLYVLGAGAGSVATEGWLAAEPWRWRRAVGALALNGVVLVGAVAPVAPARVYADMFHDVDPELGEEVGWPELVDLVAAVVEVLPADEQADVRVVTADRGAAAAIDLYGPARGLPRGTALSVEGGYADWWPDGEPAGTFVTVRYPRRAIEPYCDAVGPVAVVETIDGVANDAAGTPLLVCRHLRVPPDELRDGLRHPR